MSHEPIATSPMEDLKKRGSHMLFFVGTDDEVYVICRTDHSKSVPSHRAALKMADEVWPDEY